MAKQRRTNTAASALNGLLNVIGTVARVELAGNADAIAEVDAMVANTKDSNFATLAEHGDDTVETAHQVEAVFEAAGIDMVEFGRRRAVEGATMTVEAIQEQQAIVEVDEVDEAEQQFGDDNHE